MQPERPNTAPRSRGAQAGYSLVVRGGDGQLHVERFDDVASYRIRVAELNVAANAVSVDELVNLLELG
jgi:hypothetical protein